MKCPSCGEWLVTLELDQVEVDHCLSCAGIWLDEGELALLLEGSENRDQFLAGFKPQEKTREKHRRCPICRGKMDKVAVPVRREDRRITIDGCPKGHGIWFDAGELGETLAAGGIETDRTVFALLKDIFGGQGVKRA